MNWSRKKKLTKKKKLLEWMAFVLFTLHTNDTDCGVCTLMCELFKWMLFINCVCSNEYPFQACIHFDKWSERDIKELSDINCASFKMAFGL